MTEEPADEVVEAPEEDKPKKKNEGSFLRELPFLLLIAFVLALVIKAFLVQAFFIPSGSMEQTLHGCPGCKGDRVLVNKLVYKFRDINRGEIVVFNGLDSFQAEVVVPPPANGFERFRRNLSNWLGLGAPGEKDFIKRVIGLPGDTVACCTNGHVTVNGVELDEPYVFEDDHQVFAEVKVPEGKLFVMGDHRSRSSDSRAHGPVPVDKVVGRAFAVVYPFGRSGILHVPKAFDAVAMPAVPFVGGVVGALPLVALRRRRLTRR